MTRLAWIPTLTPDTGASAGVLARSTPVATARERLFEALDGRVLTAAGRNWRVEVYSISEQRGSWWLQLALEGDPAYAVTMRASFADAAEQTVQRLSNWLANPGASHDALTII